MPSIIETTSKSSADSNESSDKDVSDEEETKDALPGKQEWLVVWLFCNFRNNRLEVFCKKVVLRNFAKFTRKHL